MTADLPAKGKDFSNWQGRLSHAALKGLDFALFKASEGTQFTDAQFPHSWRLAKSTGMHCGAYHFFHPSLDPARQARWFVDAVRAHRLSAGDMLACDMEDLEGLTGERANRAAKMFLDTVAALVPPTVAVLVYTNHDVGQHLTSCVDYPLWFAWPSSAAPGKALLRPWEKWAFWQYGVRGVDRDAFSGPRAALDAFVASYAGADKTKVIVAGTVADGVQSIRDLVRANPRNGISTVLRLTAEHSPGGKFRQGMPRYIDAGTWDAPLPSGAEVFFHREVPA